MSTDYELLGFFALSLVGLVCRLTEDTSRLHGTMKNKPNGWLGEQDEIACLKRTRQKKKRPSCGGGTFLLGK